MKKIWPILCIIILIPSGAVTSALQITTKEETIKQSSLIEDYDPLIDISVTIDIIAIRALDEIDCGSKPDFFMKLFINEEEFTSRDWEDEKYLYDCWSITKDVDDSVELVDISMQLFDKDPTRYEFCDISGDKNKDVDGFDINIKYSLKTGKWHGDDYYLEDPSGYGRLNGCDDGSIYKDQNDCELWFNIYQTDYDNDGLPYYTECSVYGTDPEVNNLGEDADEDGIPIEWEHRFGYNPLIWEDHEHLDPDGDSLNNTEEYLTWDFWSDPFRQDIFLEMDFMEDITGAQLKVPDETYEILQNPFNRRNIVFHTDYGQVEGGEMIPFDDDTGSSDLLEIYDEFFLHGESDNWRRGVFHYGIVVYYRKPSMAFSGDVPPYWGYQGATNSFVISNTGPEYFYYDYYKGRKSLEYLWASNFMHEMGHNFGIRFGKPFGCDNQLSTKPWFPAYWHFWHYKSIMNYRYVFDIFDYSDSTHGRNDYDDWENLDLSYFEKSSATVIRQRAAGGN